MKKSRRVLAMLCALTLMAAMLAGCADNGKGNGTTAPATSGAQTSAGGTTAPSTGGDKENVTMEIMFSNHDSQPYTEATWLLPKAAKEKFNITLNMNAIPAASFEEKRNSTLASGEIPDLIMGVAKDVADKYGKLGMFMNFAPYIDSMPNMKAAMEAVPDIKANMPSETEFYAQPAQITTKGSVNTAAYFIPMVRMDLMKKLNIEAPKTFDDFYNMLKALKDNNTSSYPWVNRQNLDFIVSVFAPGLGIDVFPSGLSNTNYAVWNKDTKTFTNIMDEENFKYFVTFMNKLYTDGLLDPSYATDKTADWEAKIVSGAGSFAVDYFARPEMMSNIAVSENPDYSLESILVPALPEGSQSVFARTGIGSWIVADAKTEHPDRLCEFLDWWRYTEEGALLTTYGIEGETYKKNDDGTLSKIFTDKVANSLDFDSAYGTNYLQFWNFRPDYFGQNLYDPSAPYWTNQVWDLMADKMIDSPPTIVKNSDEMNEWNDKCTDLLETIRTKINEMIMGRRPLSDWDAVKAEIDAAGMPFNLEQLNTIYARIYG